jgi:hypothetical protein
LPGEQRLREPEFLRGLREAQFLCDSDEVPQVAKFHTIATSYAILR